MDNLIMVYMVRLYISNYIISHCVGNHFLKLLANLSSNYWNLLAKIKFH